MGLKKGQTNNPNGRPKGKPNKTTAEIREAYQSFVENNIPNFEEWLNRVAKTNPAKAIELVTGLSEYFLPKLQRSEIVGDKENPLELDLAKLDEQTIKSIIEAIISREAKS